RPARRVRSHPAGLGVSVTSTTRFDRQGGLTVTHSIRLLSLVIVLAFAFAPALGPAVAPALAAGRDMVIGLSGDATSLNPVVATDGISYTVEWPVFDSLLELDASLNVKPLLAESGEASKAGLTNTSNLKKA